MTQARVCFEFNGRLFLIGCTRAGWAMRSLNSREVSLLQPFQSIAAAQQMCKALAQAQVLAFFDHEGSQVDGLGRRKWRSGRPRRRLRRPATLASMTVRRPPVPLDLDGASHPSARASSGTSPHEGSSHRAIPRRSRARHTPPAPETIAQLDEALHHVEKTLG
jgi:hypothetical protein